MRLVEIASLVGGVGKGGIGGVCCNEAPQADNGSILLRRGAYDRPEPFFKSVLADVQGARQVFDLYDPAVLPDQVKGVANKRVRFIVCQVFPEEGLYNVDPALVVFCFGKALQDLAEVCSLEYIFRFNMLLEQFVCRQPGKSIDTTWGKNNQEVGAVFGIGKLPDRFSQTCDGGAGKRQLCPVLDPHNLTHIPECHYHGCIRYSFTADVQVALDDEKLSDKWK